MSDIHTVLVKTNRNLKRILLNLKKFYLGYNYLILLFLLIIIVLLVILCDSTDLFGKGYQIWHSKFFDHFFVDGYNKFNWVGITVLATIIGLTFNAWDSRKKYQADLISKNRIVWIDKLKPIVAEYVGLCYAYMRQTNNLLYNQSKLKREESTEKKEKLISELLKQRDVVIDLQVKIFEKHGLISIYIPDNKSNEEINQPIKELNDIFSTHFATVLKKYSDHEGKKELRRVRKEFEEKLENVISSSRNYFKKEWENAKKGK